MSATILDGKKLSFKIKESIKSKVLELKERNIIPGLAVVIVGDNAASRIYVNSKKKACSDVLINSYEYALKSDVEEEELLNLIQSLNLNPNVNGILVQLPLPAHIDAQKVINSINPIKDVDCFHPENIGRLLLKNSRFLPCTPAGIIELINLSEINLKGKHSVVIGRSNIVGKPLSLLLLSKDSTVTVCHSFTENLTDITRSADILIAAVGKANIVTKDMVKKGAVVIDVGMNRENNRLCGDVDFENVSKVCAAITPVPGGVGPMTITMLLQNTVLAANLQNCSI